MACWQGYTQKGMKKKGKKMVPNCVPRTKAADGGLPKAAAIRDGFAWHESALGYANGIEITTKVDWSTDKDSWKSTGYLKAGCVIRDIDGMVKYQATEA